MNFRELLVSRPLATIKKQRIFRDKLFGWFLAVAVLLCVAVVLALAFTVRPQEFVVPLQYSSLQGFDVLGRWYLAYAYGLFSVLVTVGNVTLAAIGFEKSRIAGFFLVLGAVIVNLFTLVVVLNLIPHLDI